MFKNTFLLLCFLISITNLQARALTLDNTDEEKQILNLESSNLKYDLGVVEEGKIIIKSIKIRNKLKEALRIIDARPTCECIKAKVQPQTVDKDQTFEVEIVFNSRDITKDAEGVVYIMTASMKYQLIRLVISATVDASQ